jgi:acetyl esterase/lipase
VSRGAVFRRVDGKTLRLDVYRPADGELHPALVYFHGGGWVAGHRRLSRLMLRRLAAAGFTTFAVSYRLAPRWPLPAALEDAKAAVAWVRQHGVSFGAAPGRPFVWGESAGGHLAALVALTAGDPRWQPGFEEADTFVRGALLCYPVTDVVGAFSGSASSGGHPSLAWLLERLAVGRHLEVASSLYRGLDPMRCEVRDLPPMLVVQGGSDSLVPRAMSERFVRRLRQAGGEASLLELPGMPHGFDLYPSPALERVVAQAVGFLRRLDSSPALFRRRRTTASPPRGGATRAT